MTFPEPNAASDGFSKYFEILPAISDNEKAAAFRIRHSVYCEDLEWETTRADGMETDAYDAHALHCLIRSRASGDFIGCVRLILTAPDDPHAPLPFERTCGPALHRTLVDPAKMPRDKIAEVSRLAIVGQYRRRRGEKHAGRLRAGQRAGQRRTAALRLAPDRAVHGRIRDCGTARAGAPVSAL